MNINMLLFYQTRLQFVDLSMFSSLSKMSTAQGQYNLNMLEIRKVRGPTGSKKKYKYLKAMGIM